MWPKLHFHPILGTCMMNGSEEYGLKYTQVMKHGRIGPVGIIRRPLFEQVACSIESIHEKYFLSKDIEKYKITYTRLFELNLHSVILPYLWASSKYAAASFSRAKSKRFPMSGRGLGPGGYGSLTFRRARNRRRMNVKQESNRRDGTALRAAT
jgi:hypothetical protein